MIGAPFGEIHISRYPVSGEAPVDRRGPTKIVADTLEITWCRDTEHGWYLAGLTISGRRARKDGSPGEADAEERWSVDRYRGWDSPRWWPTEPPLWATLMATGDTPAGGPLSAPVAAQSDD